MRKVSYSFYLLIAGLFLCSTAHANTLNLTQLIEKALVSDPRIDERQAMVDHARGLLAEAENSDGISLSLNSFVGFSPGLDGGIYETDKCGNGTECKLRDDRFELADGLSPWFFVQYSLIKPLKTFGKIENYSIAAKHNIQIKKQDVRIQRGNTIYDVKRAYHGYLTANNTRLFLQGVEKRVSSARETIELWLEEDEGKASQSDFYALQSAAGLVHSYVVRAKAMETVAMEGLKVLIGMPLNEELTLADSSIVTDELPEHQLAGLKEVAMKDRPEIIQLNEGLSARRALVRASQSMNKPNIYAGLVGMLSYSPLRDRVDNPHITDPFNDTGTTPIVGLQWSWAGGVQNARVKQAQAELNALMAKNSLAQRGIPYQVSEAYALVHANYEATQALMMSAKAARKWMITSYTDFDAGLAPVDKLVTAFQGYVLSYTQYLTTVYDYNMQVANLQRMTGAYQ